MVSEGLPEWVESAYEEGIQSLCRNLAKRLPQDEQGRLWLVSNAYFNGDEDDGQAATAL